MFWFQHHSDHLADPFQHELMRKFGSQGYLVYWGVLSFIARDSVSGHLTGKGTFSRSFLKQKLHISPTKIQEILEFCRGKRELLLSISGENFNIEVPKLLELLDNTERNLQAKNKRIALELDYINNNNNSNNIEGTPVGGEEKFTEYDSKTAVWMYEKILNILPDFKKPNFNTWAYEINLLHRIDGKPYTDIHAVFNWANKDYFWQANILNPQKLRKHWDQLEAKVARAKKEMELELELEREPEEDGADFYRKISLEIEDKEKAELEYKS